MKNTKIVGLFLIVTLLFTFIGCGRRKEPPKQRQTDISIKEERAVFLPDGYPTDLVPIMEDAISGSGMETAGNFNISYSTPSSAEEVMSFYTNHFSKYKDAMKLANNRLELNLEVDSQKINIQLDESGEKTSVRISIVGQGAENSSSEAEETSSSASGKFPTNLVPLMRGASIIDEVNEKDQHAITYQIKKPFKETANFYRKAVKKMTNANISQSQGEFYATAKKGNSSIEIQIAENAATESMVMINIYPQ